MIGVDEGFSARYVESLKNSALSYGLDGMKKMSFWEKTESFLLLPPETFTKKGSETREE